MQIQLFVDGVPQLVTGVTDLVAYSDEGAPFAFVRDVRGSIVMRTSPIEKTPEFEREVKNWLAARGWKPPAPAPVARKSAFLSSRLPGSEQ